MCMKLWLQLHFEVAKSYISTMDASILNLVQQLVRYLLIGELLEEFEIHLKGLLKIFSNIRGAHRLFMNLVF